MEKIKMSEADLCLKLEEFYSDGEIYKEVPAAGGRCDMFTKRFVKFFLCHVYCFLSLKGVILPIIIPTDHG